MNIDKDNLLELYDRCENEKRRLADRNARLTVSGRMFIFLYLIVVNRFLVFLRNKTFRRLGAIVLINVPIVFVFHCMKISVYFISMFCILERELAMELERVKISKGLLPKKVS